MKGRDPGTCRSIAAAACPSPAMVDSSTNRSRFSKILNMHKFHTTYSTIQRRGHPQHGHGASPLYGRATSTSMPGSAVAIGNCDHNSGGSMQCYRGLHTWQLCATRHGGQHWVSKLHCSAAPPQRPECSAASRAGAASQPSQPPPVGRPRPAPVGKAANPAVKRQHAAVSCGSAHQKWKRVCSSGVQEGRRRPARWRRCGRRFQQAGRRRKWQ